MKGMTNAYTISWLSSQLSFNIGLKLNRVRQLLRRICPRTRLDQMRKRRRPLHARRKRSKIPEIAQSPENGRGAVRDRVARRILGLPLDNALLNPWRNKQSRNAAPEAIERESVLAARGHLLGVSQIVRPRGQRRRNVVMEATSLVVGQDEERLVPLGAGSDGLVDILDEGLAV